MAGSERQLSALQLDVLRALWTLGEGRVSEVHRALEKKRRIALTTVATLLTRLEKRGVVEHRTEGRNYVYRACVSEQDAQSSMVSDLMDRLFTGDVTELVNHLLSSKDIQSGDLERIKEMIAARERELGEE